MTPFIAVILVLLMVMITGIPGQRDIIFLKIPDSFPACGMKSVDYVNVYLDFDDTILWNGEPVSQAELQQHLPVAVNEQAEVYLRPSSMSSYAAVMAISNHMLRAGIKSINLVAPLSPS
ncbi:MAG: biopolymer transporter ExbD [Pseudomonadota bacterium]